MKKKHILRKKHLLKKKHILKKKPNQRRVFLFTRILPRPYQNSGFSISHTGGWPPASILVSDRVKSIVAYHQRRRERTLVANGVRVENRQNADARVSYFKEDRLQSKMQEVGETGTGCSAMSCPVMVSST